MMLCRESDKTCHRSHQPFLTKTNSGPFYTIDVFCTSGLLIQHGSWCSSTDDEESESESTGSVIKEKEAKKERKFYVKGDLVTAIMDNQGPDVHEAELSFLKVLLLTLFSTAVHHHMLVFVG